MSTRQRTGLHGLPVREQNRTPTAAGSYVPVPLSHRLGEPHGVAGISSWEWRPDSDELTVFHGLPGSEVKTGTRGALEEMLAAIDPDLRSRAREDLRNLERGDADETAGIFRRREPSGAEWWIEVRSRAVRGAGGGLVCVRGTAQDVTLREDARIRNEDRIGFLQATLDALPSQIAVLDASGALLLTNLAWRKAGTGLDGGQYNYLDVCDRAVGDPWAVRAGAGIRSVLGDSERQFTMEYPCDHGADKRWFRMVASRHGGSGAARAVVAHEEVTGRHVAELDAETRAELLDEVDAAVVATDPEGNTVYWNCGAERLFGWTSQEASGRPIAGLVLPADPQAQEQIRDALQRDGCWEGEFAATRRDGSSFPAYTHARVITDSAGRPTRMIGVSADMTERVSSIRALAAANRHMRAVTDNMGEGLMTLDAAGRLTYMNAAAETLLGWPAAELEGQVMHDATHAHRADGTPFPIEECPILRARRDGQIVRVEEDAFIRRDGKMLPVAYAASPFETEDGIGGCAVVFEDITERKAREETQRRDAEKLGWIDRIRAALDEDRFELHAQPIADIETGEFVQRELLIRMRQPDGSLIGPTEFLPIAEEYGLIDDIDRWVVGRAIAIAATGLPVELNLSGRSVGDPSMLEHVTSCLDATGADPATVVFEITETAIVSDEAAARVFIDRLHELGCKIALDDFGTGYGSFTYLKQLPIDYLKIDVEFVRDIASNTASYHVAEAVVALARSFGLHTVAEGVEDEATLQILRVIGADYVQGFHIGRPLPYPAPVDGASTGG